MTKNKDYAKNLLLQALKNELEQIKNLPETNERQYDRIKELESAILIYEK